MTDCCTAADYATVGSAVFAAIGLCIVGYQVREARRAAELQTLQKFMSDVREHEHALAQTAPERISVHFQDYLNMLEVYAAALNMGLASGVATEFIREKLKDALVIFEMNPSTYTLFEEAITSSETFCHIGRFYRTHRRLIEETVRVRKSAQGQLNG